MFTAGKFGSQRTATGLDPAMDVVGVPIEVYFSPEDRPEKRLVELVRGAQKSILVLAYSFTSDPLSDALLDQADAGVSVQGVFDASQVVGRGRSMRFAPGRTGCSSGWERRSNAQ